MECLLQDLGIKHARFEVAIREAEEFLGNGKDEVSFLFAANKINSLEKLRKWLREEKFPG